MCWELIGFVTSQESLYLHLTSVIGDYLFSDFTTVSNCLIPDRQEFNQEDVVLPGVYIILQDNSPV